MMPTIFYFTPAAMPPISYASLLSSPTGHHFAALLRRRHFVTFHDVRFVATHAFTPVTPPILSPFTLLGAPARQVS